jgi:hypothetical protein
VHAALARQLGHVERRPRIGDPRPLGVRQAGLVEHPPLTGAQRPPVAGLELLDRDPLRRVLRMQVERQPLDLSAVPALEPRRALSRDVAEGSYVVGPDPDQGRHTSGLYPIVPVRASKDALLVRVRQRRPRIPSVKTLDRPGNEKSGPPTARSLLLGAYPSTAPWK